MYAKNRFWSILPEKICPHHEDIDHQYSTVALLVHAFSCYSATIHFLLSTDDPMPGFLFLDKPAGMTSHDVINRVRRLTNERRVGHAGTLDPFATGLLIVAVEREATRELSKFVGLNKTYEATFILGTSSDTDDVEGVITPLPLSKPFNESQIRAALQQFIGQIDQLPPSYSAIKIGGKKMYEAAREGKPLEAKPRRITIYNSDLKNVSSLDDSKTQQLSVSIHCSSGTYIRAIARDLGRALGTGGYVSVLRRTSIGPIQLSEATSLKQLELHSIPDVLARL